MGSASDRKTEKHLYYLKNKTHILARNKNWYQHNKKWHKHLTQKWKLEHKDEFKEYHKQYYKENKKEIDQKHREYYAKNKDAFIKRSAKRLNNFGFNKLCENPFSCKIDWHHIDNENVVALPRDIHKHCLTGDSKKHREACLIWIYLLYFGIY